MSLEKSSSTWSKIGPILAGLGGAALYDQYAYEGLPKSKEDLPRGRVMNFLVNTPIVAGGAALAKSHPVVGIPLMLSPPAKDLALGSLPLIHHAPELLEEQNAQMALRNRILAGTAAAGLGLGALHLLKKRKPSTTTIQMPDQPGRIQVTLPTKDPSDAETVVDLPIGAVNMSQTQLDKLNRDVRRRIRSESRGRTKKRDPETGKLIPYEDYQMKYASSGEILDLQNLKKAMLGGAPATQVSLPSLQTSALRQEQNADEGQAQAQEAAQQAELQNSQEQQKYQAALQQERQKANIAQQQAAAAKAQLDVEKSKSVPSAVSPALKAVSNRLDTKLKSVNSPGSWDTFKTTTKGASRVDFLMKCAAAAAMAPRNSNIKPAQPKKPAAPPAAAPAVPAAQPANTPPQGTPVIDLSQQQDAIRDPEKYHALQKQWAKQYQGGGAAPVFVGGSDADRRRAYADYWQRRNTGDYANRQKMVAQQVGHWNDYIHTGNLPAGSSWAGQAAGKFIHPAMKAFAGAGDKISRGEILSGLGDFAVGTAQGTLMAAPFAKGLGFATGAAKLPGAGAISGWAGRQNKGLRWLGNRTREGVLFSGASALRGALPGTSGLSTRPEALRKAEAWADQFRGRGLSQSATPYGVGSSGYGNGYGSLQGVNYSQSQMLPSQTFGQNDMYAPVDYGSGVGNLLIPYLSQILRGRVAPAYQG